MKKLILMAVVLLMTTTGLLAQTKAGKVDTTKHTTLYFCPKDSEVTKMYTCQCTPKHHLITKVIVQNEVQH